MHLDNRQVITRITKFIPNPNDGNFILQQYIADEEAVCIKIMDVTGRVIINERQTICKFEKQVEYK
jgi:hypothetical protein